MRLIDAKKAEKEVKIVFKENPVVMGLLLRWIRKQPTIDAEPVRHGRWVWRETGEEDYEMYWVCSACGDKTYYETNYCPNCGVKMDLEG